MKTFIIILIVCHYIIPLVSIVLKKLNYSILIGFITYTVTLIALHILVCIFPEIIILKWWLGISTVLCILIGVLSTGEHNDEEDKPGSIMLIPGIIGVIIWGIFYF